MEDSRVGTLTALLRSFRSRMSSLRPCSRPLRSRRRCAVLFAIAFCALPLPTKAESDRGYTVDTFARVLRLEPSRHLLKPATYADQNSVFLETRLGAVALRYPDSFAGSLKRRPAEIVTGAWEAAAAFLERGGFPEEVRRASFGWNVLVAERLSAEVADSKVSSEYCHTALMGPPADILIDSYRLFHPCSASYSSVTAENRLSRSLVHEVGHAVEYKLLGHAFGRRQRWHSEGFASWFESEAARELRGVRSEAATTELRRRARNSFDRNWKPYLFRGSPQDYAQSYAMIAVIAETESVQRLRDVYSRMSADNCTFSESVERELGWSFADWVERTGSFLSEVS